MAIKYNFVDGMVYGTDDVNEITSSLVGAGVAPFAVKDSYNVSELNALTEAVVGDGVQRGGCKCTVSGVGNAEFIITVAQGSVFFESGVRLEVDEEGYDIYAENNVSGYVFANYNPSLQTADILFEAQVSDVGESVVLAFVSVDGVVTDLRKTAEAKIASMGKNIMVKRPFERVDQAVLHNGKYIVSKVPGVDVSRFNYVVLVSTDTHGDSQLKYFPEVGYYMSFFDIMTNKQNFSIYPGGYEKKVATDRSFYTTVMGLTYHPEIVGGELCILCNCSEDEAQYAIKDALGCTACFM